MNLHTARSGPAELKVARRIRKIEISKNSKLSKTKILKTFIEIYPRDRSRNCFQQDRILVLTIGDKTFASSSPCAPSAMCEVHT
jgi:hypothetical protein